MGIKPDVGVVREEQWPAKRITDRLFYVVIGSAVDVAIHIAGPAQVVAVSRDRVCRRGHRQQVRDHALVETAKLVVLGEAVVC